jgi:hypothetical protein
VTASPIACPCPLGPKGPDRSASPIALLCPLGPKAPDRGAERLTGANGRNGQGSANGESPWLIRFRDGGSRPPPVPATNADGGALEPVGVLLDKAGDPALPCPSCGRCSFHQAPGDRWRCSGCEPPKLPDDGAALAGWVFCCLPPRAEVDP